MTGRLSCSALVLALAAGLAPGAAGQLLSPGPLASPHVELEGLRQCTSCHQLGRAGVSAERCLGCHEELALRVTAGSGYHASVSGEACASCHQDHLGRDFQLVRLDEGSFDHDAAGYPLELSHAELECRSCHAPSRVRDPVVRARRSEGGGLSRTFLGLAADCAGCHAEESPHGQQFPDRACADCHDAGRWEEPVGFDHAAARFPLNGLHAEAACAECHGTGESARFRPLPFGACSDCHADPHRGAMAGACATCHEERGWGRLRDVAIEGAFDHSMTTFPLRGAHAVSVCTACHVPGRPPRGEVLRMAYRQGTAARAYPRPVAESCASCHVDRHASPIAAAQRWARCSECHSEAAWAPSAFGLAQHGLSPFPLTGAHATAPCVACHEAPAAHGTRFPLAVVARACSDCHADEDPHEGRYAGLACETCHSTEAFDVVAFDHALAGPETTCAGCHAPDDPHAGQFAQQDCASCHGTERFEIESFDHTATRFALDGAHERTACAGCHLPEGPSEGETFVRYRPLATECADCHGGAR
jgi:hypothetical protein